MSGLLSFQESGLGARRLSLGQSHWNVTTGSSILGMSCLSLTRHKPVTHWGLGGGHSLPGFPHLSMPGLLCGRLSWVLGSQR